MVERSPPALGKDTRPRPMFELVSVNREIRDGRDLRTVGRLRRFG